MEGGYLKNLKRIKDMDYIGTKSWLLNSLDFHPFNEEHKILKNVDEAKDCIVERLFWSKLVALYA